jgi:hypothetical protein
MVRFQFPIGRSVTARRARPMAFCALMLLLPDPAQAEPRKGNEESAVKNIKPVASAAVEVRFTDNSFMKLTVLDDKIDLMTPYGKLYIPIADIRRIECGLRVPDEVAKRVEAAIDDLGNSQYRRREAAGAILLALREKAYPAVIRATKHHDMEIANRAEELVKKLQETVPADLLKPRDFDIIHTDQSKIAGRIESPFLRATTVQFGDVQLRLADVYVLSSKGAELEADLSSAGAAPTNMVNYNSEIGRTFVFKVTANASGSLWGTDAYSSDSSLATAVIHAGLLQPGQTGVIRVAMIPAPNFFVGSTRNGVTSSSYQSHPAAYRVSK